MQPGRQWKERIDIWIQAIKEQIYRPIGEATVSGFYTFEQLTKEQALEQEFVPVEKGTLWGKKWEYGWFRALIVLPKEAGGKRIVCIPDVGAEALCFVNSKDLNWMPRGAFDKQHKEILLSTNAREDEQFELLLEAYAGHGPRLENGGPYPEEVIPVPEPPQLQCKVGKISYGIWQEEAYQLYIDAFVLWDLYQVLDAKSLRAMKILEGLKQFTYLADVELPLEERLQSFVEAREVLQPLLACKNGDSTPVMSICGQSHLDLAWLWTVEETKRKSGRTYSNQLTLMEEYPDYKFLACDPYVLDLLKTYYPEVYQVFLQKVADGQMILEGATYVEPDLNIPCGESLFRHFIYGKEAFAEISKEAGIEPVDSKLLWVPDVFGFPGSIPQILKLCGIPYFSTQKLMRADPETEPFPYNNFIWEGIDGSQVLAHLHMKNNTRICPHDLHDRWFTHRQQETGIDGMLYPFGFGDGGGGPTRDMVEIAARVENLEGIPKTKMVTPVSYFEDVERDGYQKPVYKGELYLAWHRGTFTSQSELKRGNRLAETTLREVEGLLAAGLLSGVFSKEQIKEYQQGIKAQWKKLMYLQFHDVLPGSSIQKVNEDAKREFKEILKNCYEMKQELFGMGGAALQEAVLPKQVPETRDRKIVQVTKHEDGFEIQNKWFRIFVKKNGTIESCISVYSGKEQLHKPGNQFHMYKNVNCMYDAWEIGSMVYDEELSLQEELMKEVYVVEETDQKCILCFTKKLHHSIVTQQICIEANSPVIYFDTSIDWQERHKLLKVSFYPEIHTREGIEEIQYGYIKRSFGENHQFEKDQYEVICHGYTALADDSGGFAVLNDAKYGVKVSEKEISLSLLRAPVIPDSTADAGMHHFTYGCMLLDEGFVKSPIVEETRKLQTRSLHKTEALHQVQELYTNDNRSLCTNPSKSNVTDVSELEMLRVSQGHVVLDWLYASEKHSGMVVARLYESMNLSEEITLCCKYEVTKVALLDPFERVLEYVDITKEDNALVAKLSFHAFEVKTIGLFM